VKESTLVELVSALDIVVMEQNAGLSFACVGRIPERTLSWLKLVTFPLRNDKGRVIRSD
jgi:hypothetical protein